MFKHIKFKSVHSKNCREVCNILGMYHEWVSAWDLDRGTTAYSDCKSEVARDTMK